MGDKWVALINNDIYEVGQTIMGKKIKNISLQVVELITDSGIEVLRVGQ